jgi:hypothetical protein
MHVMKRMIATAAVCGASLFGFTAVAGADPSLPSPNDNGPDHTATACAAVLAHNQALKNLLNGVNPTPPGINHFYDLGTQVFCTGS